MKFAHLLLLTAILLTLLACSFIPMVEELQSTAVAGTLEAFQSGTETADQIATFVAATVAAQSGSAGAPAEAGSVEATATPETTTTPDLAGGELPPTATASVVPQDLILGDVGFSQEERRVSLGFFVRNPNPELTIIGANYTVTILDSSGKILYLDDNVLPVLFPDHETGIAINVNLPEDNTAASVTVAFQGGKASQTGPMAPLNGRHAVIWAEDGYVQVAAEFDNPHPFFIENITASVILFDLEGRIGGGGVRYWNFVGGMDSNAVTVPVSGDATAVRAELYLLLFVIPAPLVGNERPDGVELPFVASTDFAPEDRQRALYTVEIRNPNPEHAIPQTLFTVIGYAQDGSIRFVETTQMDTLGPGMSSVMGSNIYLNGEDEDLSRIEVNLNENVAFEPSGPIPPITFENIQVQDDGIGYTFVADLVNPHPTDLENVWIYVIARNENDVLIYINWETASLVPGGQTLVVDNWAPQLEIEPASVEMYLLPGWDDLNE